MGFTNVTTVQGTRVHTVSAGSIARWYAEDAGIMTQVTGATVTGWTLDDVAKTLPFSFIKGQKIEATFSNAAPVTITAKWDRTAIALTSVQDQANSDNNPSPSANGFGGEGIYDPDNGRWLFAYNPGTGISITATVLMDNTYKIWKSIGAVLASGAVYFSQHFMTEHGNYIFVMANTSIKCIHKTTKAITNIPVSIISFSLFKFTSNSGVTRIIVGARSSIVVINPSDLTYTTVATSANTDWGHMVFSTQENRVLVGGGVAGKLAYLNIEGTPALDGAEIATTAGSHYINISSDGTKLYFPSNTSTALDVFTISTRTKTTVTISQLLANNQKFVYQYGNYIYVWLTNNTIVVINATTLLYVKTISGVNGAYFGLIDGNNIWCCNGSTPGYVSKFNLVTETVVNYSVNSVPWFLSKHPITGQIWVGCIDNTTSPLSIITP